MTCEINNTIEINFKNGKRQELKCSYLSFGSPLDIKGSQTLQVHGANNIILSVNRSDIDSFMMTDNPTILIDEK